MENIQIVNYVGNTLDPEADEITVEQVVEVFAEQFPEFLLAVAEENWIRGYQQALNDAEEGEKLYKDFLDMQDEQTGQHHDKPKTEIV